MEALHRRRVIGDAYGDAHGPELQRVVTRRNWHHFALAAIFLFALAQFFQPVGQRSVSLSQTVRNGTARRILPPRLFLPMVANDSMTARASDMLQSSKIGGMKGSNTKTGENVAWSGVRQWMSLLPFEPNPIFSTQSAAGAGREVGARRGDLGRPFPDVHYHERGGEPGSREHR
ncbi:hypothetical protein [Sphingopyxis sp. JAI128]|uniref:hypothetical protein n=1 Tax=Sphingopyxis sp. JAI128 TaxID=2723066 RepID=UPI00161137F1|nr:hypothetical protein [Sphingopyxis sp. JAI128]MBB6427199.1 hypothetical protein [Sphingopyxis sp. JAI128]